MTLYKLFQALLKSKAFLLLEHRTERLFFSCVSDAKYVIFQLFCAECSFLVR